MITLIPLCMKPNENCNTAVNMESQIERLSKNKSVFNEA